MASLDFRLLIVALYASTIPVSGRDGGESCAASQVWSMVQCVDNVQVLLQVSVLNETVSAVPVQATRRAQVVAPKKPSRNVPKVNTRSKFLAEQTHFKTQMDAMRTLRRQFSTAPPHFDREVEYYDQALDEYDEYVAEKERKFDLCKADGRPTSGDKYLVQDSGTRANGYEMFPGVGVYRFHTKTLRWEDARRQCEAEDAQLMVVNSQEEANVTVEMFARCPYLQGQNLNDYAYVGVRQVTANGDYVTVQGENVGVAGYSNWDFGHPDPTPTKNVKCVSINREGYLVDLDCHHRLAYFCEYEGI